MSAALLDVVRIQDRQENVDAAYAAEVDWAQGYRLNPDSRLLLVGVTRLVKRHGNLDKQRTALVLGSQFGSLSSYEAFHDSVAAKAAQPLPYTHALPSTPTAAVSIRFGLIGPNLTVSGEAEVGVTATCNALMLLASGRCDTAIAGCWHTPSLTAREAGLPERAELLLLVLQRTAGAESFAQLRALPMWKIGRRDRTCVSVLSDWLKISGALLEDRTSLVPG